MKKILILANNSIGLYNFRFELIQELIKEKYEVYFALPELIDDDKVKLIEEYGGKHIYTAMNRRGMNPLKDLKLIKRYNQIIKEINPDTILTYTIKPNIYGNYVANKYKIPVIINITGVSPSLKTGLFKKIINGMYKYAANKSNTVFFQNESDLEYFISNKLVDKYKTKMVPGSGVNTSRFQFSKYPFNNGTAVFNYVGRIMKIKGIEEFLYCSKQIKQKYPNVIFNVIGSFDEEQYEPIVKEYNDLGIIRYLGHIEDMMPLIQESNAIIHAGHSEGMSNVLLEHCSVGRPCIAPNIPGCKEIVEDGKNGYLFEVGNAQDMYTKIETFIKLNHEEKVKMGSFARLKVEQEFERTIVVSEYMKTIDELILQKQT